MEADWEFEIVPDAPVIDAAWDGLVDLGAAPGRVREIAETVLVPGLADVLVRLNAAASPVRTSKCDVWTPQPVDPDELDAAPAEAPCALACYIDLLSRNPFDWAGPALAEAFGRALCAALRAIPLRCCRADLVVRRALVLPGQETLGITAYLVACATDRSGAESMLAQALAAFADSIAALPGPQSASIPLK